MLARRALTAAGGGSGFPSPIFEISAAPAGGWIWFTDPRAVTYAGVVYFAYVKGSNGDLCVGVYDEAARTFTERVVDDVFQVDDHAGPSLLVRDSDHKLLVFYSAHDAAAMHLKISTTSLDTDPDLSDLFGADTLPSFGGTDYTYPVPIQLTGETNDPIYLFYRDIVSSPTQQLVYNKSTDGGATWGSRQLVYQQSGRSSYWKIARNGTDRIDFAVSDGHPAVDSATAIYHFYYQGGSYYKSDGTSAGSPTLGTANLTLVQSGATSKTWIMDAAVDGSGKPHMTWVRYATAVSDLRYVWSRWTGSAWDSHEFASSGASISSVAGSNYYPGGVGLDQSDPTILYASLATGTEMWRYATTDGGTTWATIDLSAGGTGKQIRPVCPLGASDVRALWMAGTYTSYTSYDVGTRAVR